MRLRSIFLALMLLPFFGLCTSLRAQLVQDFNPPKTDCCLAGRAETLAGQLQDWNQLGRYHQDDLRLESQPRVPGRVVFLGDSITDIWNLAKFFRGKPYVNRGISGQTTTQMLARMYPDVIDLEPDAVVLLAGTNDIARNTGPETAKMIEENFRAITELAQTHHIKVILCSLTPVSDYTAHPQTVRRPPAQILELNAWIKNYAAEVNATFADYYSALVDSKGMLKNGYSNDGLHPNDRGFALLAPVAEAAIEKAMHEKK
ncbi:MAG TPA: SGNH/GDSL hydrolase family protein [Terriglobia bacterium]|nr:SGNH/GDSL hydrolase family protein [Terriglobia bacterium]